MLPVLPPEVLLLPILNGLDMVVVVVVVDVSGRPLLVARVEMSIVSRTVSDECCVSHGIVRINPKDDALEELIHNVVGGGA